MYRPILRSGYTLRDAGSPRSVRNALKGATINKAIFSVFTMAGAVLPFFLYWLTQHPLAPRFGLLLVVAMPLRVAVALSVILVFGYVVLYSVQVLPTFVSSGSFAPLSQLPLTAGETSGVAVMTLWRTLDYIVVLSLLTQLAAVAYFTGSVAACAIVLVATASGCLLAVGAALWMTSFFRNKLEGGSMAGLRGLFRPLFFVLWGLGVMSAVFLFSLVTYLAPPLNDLLSQPNHLPGLLVSLVFPFSAGLLVSHFAGETISGLSLVSSSAGLLLMVVGCAGASLGARQIINAVVLPGTQSSSGTRTVRYSFRSHGALAAYMLKDIRTSSRNPATGFLFALPVFEIFAVVLPLTATPVLRMSLLLAATQACGGFALFVAFLLVTVEDLGVERKTGLPFEESVRTLSKVAISFATFVPVLLALAAIVLSKPATYSAGLAIPLTASGSVMAACVVEVVVLRALYERGLGPAVRFAVGVGSGECLLVLPALLYSVEYLLSKNHLWSIESLVGCTLVELAAAVLLLGLMGRNRGRAAVAPEAGGD